MTRRSPLWLFVALVTTALMGCGEDIGEGQSPDPQGENSDPQQEDDTERCIPGISSVYENGPCEVAYRYDEFTYTPPGASEEREIPVSIWYPTLEEEGQSARYIGTFAQQGIWEDAEPALEDDVPVMVFSHGNGSLSTQSYYWTEYLASHGWIVIAPDHMGNTFWTMDDLSIDLSSGVERPPDITATLDYLYDLPDDDPLAGKASQDVAISGHSFGGYTSIASSGASFAVDEVHDKCAADEIDPDYCELLSEEHDTAFRDGFVDERIDVAIPMTPGGAVVFGDGLASIDIPVLVWTAGKDRTLPNEEEGDPIWESLRSGTSSDHVRIDITDAGHFTFSNMCALFGDAVDDVGDDGCSDEFINHEIALPLSNAYSLEFLRFHLMGDNEAGESFTPDHTPRHETFEISFP